MDSNDNEQFKGIFFKESESKEDIGKIDKDEFNKLYKKNKNLGNQLSDEELDTLQSTLTDLGIHSVINMDLEHLNSKIEEFSLKRSEEFLIQLNGDFKNYVDGFLIQLSNLDGKINSLNISNINDSIGVNELYGGIQKIEEKNHRIKLRNINKKKLSEYMKNLLEQLTITPQRREVLLHTQYISMSELVIVNEVLDNFVKFYKNRKFDKIDMDIIKEGDKFYNYIKNNSFKESNLLRGLPKFRNEDIKAEIKNLKKKIPSKKERLSLKNYLLDRKFVAQHLNSLFEGQQDLNEINAFKLCSECISKGMRDSFAKEFNSLVNLWGFFFESETLDESKFNLSLDSETFSNFDAFKYLYYF